MIITKKVYYGKFEMEIKILSGNTIAHAIFTDPKLVANEQLVELVGDFGDQLVELIEELENNKEVKKYLETV